MQRKFCFFAEHHSNTVIVQQQVIFHYEKAAILFLTCVLPPTLSWTKLRDREADGAAAEKNEEKMVDNPNAISSWKNITYKNYQLVCNINPFPHMDAFWRFCSRQKLKTSNFSFCPHVFNSIQLLYFHLKGVSNSFRVCIQSCLRQICCMWEQTR